MADSNSIFPAPKPYGWKSADPTLAHTYLLPSVLSLMPDNRPLRILDAGCGNGFLAGRLSDLGHQVIGVDISPDGIEIARRTYPQVRFEVASLYDDLTFCVSNIDLIVSSEVIEHLYSPAKFLLNMYSLLSVGGSIILTTPFHGYLKNLALSLFDKWDFHHTADWEGGHIKFFSQKTLNALLQSTGFDQIVYHNAGRIPFLWKSMVCRARKHA